MKQTKQIVLLFIAGFLLASCGFIESVFTYKNKTEQMVETILKEDYHRAVSYFATEHEMAKNTNMEAMKEGLSSFREVLIDNFGTELNYSLMKSEKSLPMGKAEGNLPQNTTLALVEISNGKELGVLEVLFDDTSNKILTINPLEVREPVPSMTIFWLFGILALCIPAFNIYMLRRISQSDLNRKWLKYITVIVFNVPAILYSAINGLSFKLLNFQILLGVSLNFMGYFNAAWAFGLPIGGIYWFWKLRQRN